MAEKKGGLASISEGRSDIHRISPLNLHVKPNWNSRDFNDPANSEHVQTLANSIAEVGVKEPLTVMWEDGKAWLVDGECRLRATMYAITVLKADIKTIPCKTEDRHANDAERLFSQHLRNNGKPFTILETAKLYKRLLDMGWQQGDIAKKAGISPGRVSQILDFNSIPEAVKTMVQAGTVAASTAMATVKQAGTAAEAQLKQGLQQAQAEGKTKVTARHVAEATGEAPRVNAKTAVKEAFEFAHIDDSDSDVVVIKLPMEQWEIIRKVLEL